MNNSEAQFILSAYRPGGEDAADPCFAAALEQARRDPGLESWLAREQEFDRLVAMRLTEIAPPSTLRDAILAGGKVSHKPPLHTRSWMLALAACAALLLAVGLVWQPGEKSETTATTSQAAPLAPWQLAALDFLSHEPQLEHLARDAGQLEAWLEEKGAAVPGSISSMLRALRAEGCEILDVSGRSVSVLCFHLPSGGLVHLVVTERELPDRALKSGPDWQTMGEWTTASWSEGRKDYMLVSESGREELTRFL